MSMKAENTPAPTSKVYAIGALLCMAGGLMIAAFVLIVALVAAGVIS